MAIKTYEEFKKGFKAIEEAKKSKAVITAKEYQKEESKGDVWKNGFEAGSGTDTGGKESSTINKYGLDKKTQTSF